MKLLLFAGTTEGRELLASLAAFPGLTALVCVATAYGGELLAGLPDRFRVADGRLNVDAMRELMRRERPDLVVDATHPYATEVSANILRAAGEAGVPRLRLLRKASSASDCVYVGSVGEAVRALSRLEGNVLLATGSKDLAAYAAVPEHAERLYPRVLPTVDAIRDCEALGFRRSHVIAMQGPFSRELNRAIMRQFDIRVLVTKDGGAAGGFPEKLLAAEDVGATVVVIGRPPETDGLDLEAVVEHIRKGLEAEA